MVDKGKSALDELRVGSKTTHSRTITETDISLFASISGDFNPVHMCQDYAEKTVFGGRIAHGVISLGLLSAAMAKLPGLPIFLSHSAKFVKQNSNWSKHVNGHIFYAKLEVLKYGEGVERLV